MLGLIIIIFLILEEKCFEAFFNNIHFFNFHFLTNQTRHLGLVVGR